MESKNIFFIGAFKNNWDEEGIAKSFEKLGHKVYRIDEAHFSFQEVVERMRTRRPDLFLCAKMKIPEFFKKKLVQEIKQAKIPFISWTFDLYFGLNREMALKQDPIFKGTYYMSPDGGNDERFKGLGINHVCLRQGIFDEYCYQGEYKEEYDHDVIFVGTENPQYPYRTELCARLQKWYGDRFKWYGGSGNQIRGDKLNDLYASAKVVVGDCVYSPHYWSNRLYETLGRGGFMIHPAIPGIDKEYIPYKHFIPYTLNNWDSLKEKIDYFLDEPEKRKQIGDAALIHTKSNHTLLDRCQELLKYVK